ncbi:MAG TPA: FHA domain-containing protein [Polyangiaceae bacterium]|nr:FHA domain-containing protein [Polyangiaceae bacterium]
MALLRQTRTGALSVVETEHLVGRSPRASLHIDQSYVSGQHASLRWVQTGWELKDLGSRNGTLVDDAPIKPGQTFCLARGNRISFGSAEQTWELIDDSPPKVMVVPLEGGGKPIFPEGDILALPSEEDPRAMVFRASDGAWSLERQDEIVPLASNQLFEASGLHFRFSCPDVVAETWTEEWPEGEATGVARLHLLFRASMDEEYVEIEADMGSRRENLGSRGHNYLLLLLARRRMSDAARDLTETACGWVYQDELVDSLRISPERLNIDIFRIRRQFASLGVSDPANIVERRPRTKQLRIGVASLTVRTI